MTLSSLQKLREREGVTLVELLVVMLIVAILAIGLLPTFVKFVIKAQYTTDAVPLVNHIRTQVGLYYYEKGRLPCWKCTEDAIWGIRYEGDKYSLYEVEEVGSYGTDDENLPAKELPSYLDSISVQLSEMQGRRLRPENVEFAVIANTNNYGYAVGVFGDSTEEGLPGNSGYAVLEMNFADVGLGEDSTGGGTDDTASTTLTGDIARGYKLVAEWSNYDKGTDRAHFSFKGSDGTKKHVGLPTALIAFPDGKTKIPTAVVTLLTSKSKKVKDTSGECDFGKWAFTAVPTAFLE